MVIIIVIVTVGCTCTDIVGIQGTPGDTGTGAELGSDVDDGMDGRGATVGGGHCLEHTL